MRDIKYRGKVCGQWEQATPDDDHWEQFWALVDRETVGQYTESKDKDGKIIYEDDLCTKQYCNVYSLAQKKMAPGLYHVQWIDDRWGLVDQNGDEYDNGDYYQPDIISWNYFEVIGNIHDNADLLENAK